MNLQTKLELLRERFFRADTAALIDTACTQGGLILKEMFDSGNMAGNPELARVLQADYLTIGSSPMERLLDDFKLASGFKNFAFCVSSNPNVLAHKAASKSNGIQQQIQKPNSFREQGENLASFCTELMAFLTEHPQTDCKYPGLKQMYRDAQANTKLAKPEKTFKKVCERYHRTLDRNDRPTVTTLKRWLERPKNH